jgi:predicted PurR-regulated permease PerM
MLKPKPPAHEWREQRSAYWWFRWVPAVVVIVSLLYLLYVVGRLALVPVLASFALAYLIYPIVYQIEKRGLSRPVAALGALLIVTLVAAGFLFFIIPRLWEQFIAVGTSLMRYFTPANALWQRTLLGWYSPALDRLVGDRLERFIGDPSGVLGSPSTWFAGGLSDFFHSAASSVDLLLVPFFVYYILVDFGAWRDALEDFIPPRFRDPFGRLFDEVGRILQTYVRGQLLISMLMGVLYAIGFVLLQVPAGAGIAILAGFLNTIPYIGTVFGILLATSFTMAAGAGFWRVGGVIGVFLAVQMIEGYFLTPRILGGRMSLHPMAVFLGMLIGGKLFGFLGIILAVPTIAVAKVFLMFLRELYKQSYFYHGGDTTVHETPSELLKERFADAADMVLIEQVAAETGDELLAPGVNEDDPIARKGLNQRPERIRHEAE